MYNLYDEIVKHILYELHSFYTINIENSFLQIFNQTN